LYNTIESKSMNETYSQVYLSVTFSILRTL
jgi:hypothetical protein